MAKTAVGRPKGNTRRVYNGLEQLESDDDFKGVFPKEFLVGLRCALEAGMTCEQITSVMVFSAGVMKVQNEVDQELLVSKARFLSGLIREDL